MGKDLQCQQIKMRPHVIDITNIFFTYVKHELDCIHHTCYSKSLIKQIPITSPSPYHWKKGKNEKSNDYRHGLLCAAAGADQRIF